MDRRRYLAALLGVGSLGGCLRLTGEDQTTTATRTQSDRRTQTASATARPTDGETPTEEPTDSPTATESETPTETETPTATPIPVGGSWPQFHADAANTGYDPTLTGPREPVMEAWRQELGGSNVSSPVVADGRVFVGTHSETERRREIRAFRLEDGELLWRQPTIGWSTASTALAVVDGVVYAVEPGGSRVVALNADSGSFRWRYDAGVPFWGSPTVVDGTVYASNTTGRLVALDARTGRERWAYDPDVRAFLSTPAVHDGTVYATSMTPEELPPGASSLFEFKWYEHYFSWSPERGTGETTLRELPATGSVHALSVDDGSVEWTKTVPDFVVSSAAVRDGTVCFGGWDNTVYALDPDTGETQWTFETRDIVVATPAIADDTVYAGSNDGTLYALSLSDGTRNWVYPVEVSVKGSPAVTDDAVYLATDGRGIVSLGRNGRFRWRFEGENQDFNASSPAVVDGAVLACGDYQAPESAKNEEFGALYAVTEAR
jgi:outer membrane protein assembly factor BamB